MKKNFFLSLILLFCGIVTFISCSKDDTAHTHTTNDLKTETRAGSWCDNPNNPPPFSLLNYYNNGDSYCCIEFKSIPNTTFILATSSYFAGGLPIGTYYTVTTNAQGLAKVCYLVQGPYFKLEGAGFCGVFNSPCF